MAKQVEDPRFILFSSDESLKNFCFDHFGPHDKTKMIYFLSSTINDSYAMGGVFCRIDEDGRIESSEYSKLDKVASEHEFVGWIKETF